MKLRTKFVALLVPLAVAPLLFLGNIAYTQLKMSVKGRMIDDVESSLQQASELLDASYRSARSGLVVYAGSNDVGDFLRTGDIEALQPSVARLRSGYAGFAEFFILDSEGRPLAHHDGRGLHAADESHFAETEPAWSPTSTPGTETLLDTANNRLLMRASQPVTDELGQVGAHLLLYLRLDVLSRLSADSSLGEEGFLIVTNAAGDVLLGDTERASRNLGISEDVGAWLRGSVAEDHYNALHGSESHHVESLAMTDDLVAWAILPTSQINQTSRKFSIAIAVITLIAALLTSGTLLLALHHVVVVPIKKIQQAADDIGRGDLNIRPLAAADDEIGALARSFIDMSTSLQDSNDHVQFLAYHDSLTGLPNRSMFRDQLHHAMAQARREHQRLAVLFLDLDDFKRINDTLGHQVGDQLLTRFSEAIAREVREGDVISRINEDESDHLIARLGGDEFIILLRNVADEYAPRNIARRICNLMRQPFIINGHELYLSSSIGISMFPEDSDTADDLIRNADAAMYHAKDLGKNNYQYFSESMNEAAAKRLKMETRLRKALENQGFELFYQPKVNPRTLEIMGAEALLRWDDEELGRVSPDAFIRVAEETGLIVPIGEWVLNTACAQLQKWQGQGLPRLQLSVNVSAIQIARQDLSFVVARSLRNCQVDAEQLDIEITESTLMSGGERAVRMLSELRGLGVSVSLDDFGTGYSSLSYLRRFPINNLKIDRSFVAEIEQDQSSRSIVAAIIAMSRSMDMSVTAEGVENEAQLEFLCEHDCDYAQGFLLSRPVPAADFERLLIATDWSSLSQPSPG